MSPRIGHLHVTVDDAPWHWVDASGEPLIIQGLPPGPHKVLVQLADPMHRVIDQGLVELVIPEKCERVRTEGGMGAMHSSSMSRRGFCLCCLGAAGLAATGGWLSPREAFAEARGLVSLIKDSAAVSPIVIHKLRNNISVLEGSGGNVAVLTGPDGKVLIDAGISVSRPQMTKALADLGADPITHLVNTHWHFDHADGNAWLNSMGAKIIAQENTRKYLSQVQRVEDWDYNFLALPPNGIPSEVFASEHALKLNGASIALKYYGPHTPTATFPSPSAKPTSCMLRTRSGTGSIRSSTIRPAAASTA